MTHGLAPPGVGIYRELARKLTQQAKDPVGSESGQGGAGRAASSRVPYGEPRSESTDHEYVC